MKVYAVFHRSTRFLGVTSSESLAKEWIRNYVNIHRDANGDCYWVEVNLDQSQEESL